MEERGKRRRAVESLEVVAPRKPTKTASTISSERPVKKARCVCHRRETAVDDLLLLSAVAMATNQTTSPTVTQSKSA